MKRPSTPSGHLDSPSLFHLNWLTLRVGLAQSLPLYEVREAVFWAGTLELLEVFVLLFTGSCVVPLEVIDTVEPSGNSKPALPLTLVRLSACKLF